MSPKRVPAAILREIDGVCEWMAEQQEATRQQDDQAATLEHLLSCLNKMARPLRGNKIESHPPAQRTP